MIHSAMKDIYVLGTGLSHDGSACLLKNGKICYAIEKERITRIKHDGFNELQKWINYFDSFWESKLKKLQLLLDKKTQS